MGEASAALTVVADVAITKGETPGGDLTLLCFPDGTARRAVPRVVHDLPHLVIESAFGLGGGLWGTLARGGPCDAWPGHVVARAAVTAVVNRWGDGPDTPDGVRDRLRGLGPLTADLADRLDDDTIRAAAVGVRRMYRQWRALPPGGTLRLTWPLPDTWLRHR